MSTGASSSKDYHLGLAVKCVLKLKLYCAVFGCFEAFFLWKNVVDSNFFDLPNDLSNLGFIQYTGTEVARCFRGI